MKTDSKDVDTFEAAWLAMMERRPWWDRSIRRAALAFWHWWARTKPSR